jgi:hypothetical protein
MASNNIVEFVIKMRENAKAQSEKMGSAFRKANADAKQLASSSKFVTHNIADLRGEMAAMQHKRSFATTKVDIERCNTSISRMNKDLKRLETLPPNGFFSRLKRAGTALTGLRLGDMGIAYAAMQTRRFVKESVKLFDVQAKAEAQVKATLESTGYAAGRTFGQLAKQASELQRRTIFGDEAILDAQSKLLTFGNIRGGIFDKTMPAILDVATKKGMGLAEAVTLIGKAINDPTSGLTAMRRVGIQFTDEQQKSIKKLMETGRLEEAQLMILTELTHRFGGSAEAAASAGMGALQQLANLWHDLKEKIGGVILRMVNGLVPSMKAAVVWMSENGRVLKSVAKAVIVATAAYTSFKIAQWAVVSASAAFKAAVAGKTIAVALFTKGLVAARAAMTAFNTVSKAGVVGLVVAAISAAAAAFMLFKKRAKSAADTMNDMRKKMEGFYVQERTQLDMLFARLRQTNPATAERKRLVNELAAAYPELNKQQLQDLTYAKDLTKSYDLLTDSIAKRARMKASEGALETVYNDINTYEQQVKDAALGIAKVMVAEANQLHAGLTIGDVLGTIEDSLLQTGVYNEIRLDKNLYSKLTDARKREQKLLNLIKEMPSIGGGLFAGGGDSASAADSIAAGGKSVKNFNITINGGLVNGVQNHFNSSSDNPETADDFMWRLSNALQMMLNDVNYAAE